MKSKHLGYIIIAAIALYALQAVLGTPTSVEYSTTATVTASESRNESQSRSESQTHSESRQDWGWASHKTLNDHFQRHGADFGAVDEDDYARMAHEFYNDRDNYQVKIDEDGTLRVYDADTGAFGAYNKNGTTRTFFKPSDGQKYFDRQPGE